MKENSKELILGTVQLGVDYGINNSQGKPSFDEAFEILDTAFKNGIRYLDTAASYGESEIIIGEYQKRNPNSFKICTKLPVGIQNALADEIEESIESMLQRLWTDKLEVLYLHRFEHCENPHVINTLISNRELGKIQKIGISIYEPGELQYILSNLQDVIDVVQIPYNILDNFRWNELLNEAQNKGVQILGRSVFLQGLCFKEVEDPFVKKIGAQSYLEWIRRLAESKNVTIAQIMMDYNKQSNLDGILVGCEKKEQLINSLEIFNKENCLTDEDLVMISDKTKEISTNIIDPRKW